jgi:uncharacterized RDD family membrane protein YckC
MAYQGTPGYQGGTPGYQGVPTYAYSDWITRVGAYLIDSVPVIAIWIVLGILAAIINSAAVAILLYLVAAAGTVAFQVYNRWILGGQGQSLGKKALGMMLLSEETGQPIGTLNAFLRDICHFVDAIICYVGFLFPLWDAKRQTIADKIMRTVVVPA